MAGGPPKARLQAKGPELGSFPLDHFRECKEHVQEYYRCLESHGGLAPMCREQVRHYLQCRMDRGLMTTIDVDKFGLPRTDFVATRMHKEDNFTDAKRAGSTPLLVGTIWQRMKLEELERDDGYEAVSGTLTPSNAPHVIPPRKSPAQPIARHD